MEVQKRKRGKEMDTCAMDKEGKEKEYQNRELRRERKGMYVRRIKQGKEKKC